jgi:hypothetical protein
MKKLLVLSTLIGFSVCVANASLIRCTIAGAGTGGEVSGSTVVTCGSLMFDNFAVLNPTGGASGAVDVIANSHYDSVTGEAFLQFGPNLGANQDEQLMFSVVGGISQIEMAVAGTNATVTERACANPIATTGSLADLCTDPSGTTSVAPLGQLTVASNTPLQPVLSSPFSTTSPVYVFKDIQTGAGGALEEFTQGFEIGNSLSTPEPVSIFLFGSGLLGLLAVARKKRRS